MGINGIATAFGERLAEKAADGLCDLFKKLWDAKGLARHKRFEDGVKPAFDLFLEIHADYEQAFRAYRQELLEGKVTIGALADRIEADMRFTAQQRVDLLAVLRHGKGSEEEAFVTAIIDYLLEPHPSISSDAESALAEPPEIAIQIWRRGLASDLRSVLNSNWPFVLDPACARPPLYGEELETVMTKMRQDHGIADSDPNWEETLRRRLAVEKLDSRFSQMVAAYRQVREEYERIRAAA